MKTPSVFPCFALSAFIAVTRPVLALFAGAIAVTATEVGEVQSSSNPDSWQADRVAARAVAAEVKAVVGENWEKVKEATFAQRATVGTAMTSAEAALDTSIVEWTARKDALAVEVRPAASTALEEVRNAREVLRQKVDGLDNATVETWNSVMSELDSAWQRVRSAAAALAVRLERAS